MVGFIYRGYSDFCGEFNVRGFSKRKRTLGFTINKIPLDFLVYVNAVLLGRRKLRFSNVRWAQIQVLPGEYIGRVVAIINIKK